MPFWTCGVWLTGNCRISIIVKVHNSVSEVLKSQKLRKANVLFFMHHINRLIQFVICINTILCERSCVFYCSVNIWILSAAWESTAVWCKKEFTCTNVKAHTSHTFIYIYMCVCVWSVQLISEIRKTNLNFTNPPSPKGCWRHIVPKLIPDGQANMKFWSI